MRGAAPMSRGESLEGVPLTDRSCEIAILLVTHVATPRSLSGCPGVFRSRRGWRPLSRLSFHTALPLSRCPGHDTTVHYVRPSPGLLVPHTYEYVEPVIVSIKYFRIATLSRPNTSLTKLTLLTGSLTRSGILLWTDGSVKWSAHKNMWRNLLGPSHYTFLWRACKTASRT